MVYIFNIMLDIVLLDIPIDRANQQFTDWAKDVAPFFGETCARTILLCTKADYEKLSEEVRNDYQSTKGRNRKWVYFGASALSRLTEVYCGLHSETPKDYDVAGQIKSNWNMYLEAYPNIDKSLITFMNDVFQMGKLIKTNLIEPHIKTENPFLIMVEQLDLSGEETVVVLADKFGISCDVCCALGRDNKRRAAKIIVTHFDDKELRDRSMELLNEKAKKRIVSDVKPVSFSRAIDEMYRADAVIVCPPMAEDGEIANNRAVHGGNFHRYTPPVKLETTLMNAWLQRERLFESEGRIDLGHLIHISGNPKDRRGTTSHWQDFRNMFGISTGQHIMFRDEIDNMADQRKVQNKTVIDDAFKIISEMINAKQTKQKPKSLKVSVDADGNYLGCQVELGRPQMGGAPNFGA